MSTMTTISPISTAPSAPSALDLMDDAYSKTSLEQSFANGYPHNNRKDDSDSSTQKGGNCESDQDATSTNSSTFWDLYLSLYLPVFLVWMRRSAVAIVALFRTLILGHYLKLSLEKLSILVCNKIPWLQPLIFQPVSASNGKVDPHAWPPPALTMLATLTIFALVVHPDGFTWIMLGKLR